MEPQGNQPNRRGRPAGSGAGSWRSKIKRAKERVEEAKAVGGDALRKAEEELDKLMANHTLHFKPEKQEEFLAKRGRKKPNKERRLATERICRGHGRLAQDPANQRSGATRKS